MTKKKKVTPSSVFIVAYGDQIEAVKILFADAELLAKELREDNEDVKILEVVRSWIVEFPEEPEAEVLGLNLEELDF